MITIRNVALTAALFGRASASTGCYPTYSGSGTYNVGDGVSSAVQETEQQQVACTAGSEGCCSSGTGCTKTVDVTVTNYYNYECISDVWCNDSGRGPSTIYASTAWSKGAECDKTLATVTVAPPAAWSGSGCPKEYSSGSEYESGDVVTVKGTNYDTVYQCVDGANSAWCGDSGYAPGTSIYWKTSWTELGSCTGTISPTTAPNYVSIPDAGGCPEEYSDAAVGTYDAGDRVSLNGLVFTCKAYPNSGYCGQSGFAPLNEDGVPDAWKMAWDITGYCEGTIGPTSSPSFDSLENMGGCPDEWTSGSKYEEGDTVSADGIVYACKVWPMGAHCAQSGYAPDQNCVEGACYWKDAWTVVGYCIGSMGPTSSPTFDAGNSVGACPDEWSAGDATTYEEGDMVAVTVSTVPLRQVAYKCKAWPYSGHCGKYAPDAFGGNLGWTLEGSCDGSMGPTASPSFDALAVSGGCPSEYSASTTDYEAGDEVSVVVSTVPLRSIKYRCRAWPNTGYCNQAGFRPGVSAYDYMGWELVGACEGSFAPTTSPTTYAGTGGTCQYTDCARGTYQVPCTTGTDGCCSSGTGCTKAVSGICDPAEPQVDVGLYSSGASYEEGDVVRIERQRYKCKVAGWCNQSGYKPTKTSTGIWTNAWSLDGMCTV